MPYSGPGDESLPDNVKKMSEKKRKQWVEVFNSSHESGDDESTAFAKANGVVKNKGWMDSLWDVEKRQLNPDEVDYNALGASETQGCANCNWFVSPDACVLVYGDIAPTGICNKWQEKPVYTPEPIPVVLVDADKSVSPRNNFIDWLAGKVAKIVGKSSASSTADADGPVHEKIDTKGDSQKDFIFYKSDDRIRFMCVYSNCFKDRHKEVFTRAAHKEYVDWATKNSVYPELRLWHAGPGSKWGQVDWMDYCDGFVAASGLVDKDKEYIADALAQQDIKTSHGFAGLQAKDSIILYRSFEISPLPAGMEANVWTDFRFKEGEQMPFSESKKQWLKDVAKVDDAVIAEWEKSIETTSANLKAMGVDYKEIESQEPDKVVAELANVTKALEGLASVVTVLKQKQEVLEQSMDKRVSDVFVAEIAKLPQGFKASESQGNVVGEKQNLKDYSWFGQVLKDTVKGGE